MIVRTVLGDVAPEELGATYAHEHLIIDSPTVSRQWPNIHLPSVDDAVAELEACAKAGVGAVIDAMPAGSGRDVRRLVDVSSRSGIHVIAATGMHTRKYYEGVEWADDPAELLADRFTAEIIDSADGVPARAGIMKVAMSGALATPWEGKLFEAAAMVHSRTRAPVITHCEQGQGAIEQIRMLTSAGVPADRILLSHTDKKPDAGYHREILSTGARVEYDQSLRQHLESNTDTAELISAMWQAGFGHQILLGTDGARRSLWSTLGGRPGLAWLKSDFPRILGRHGIDDAGVETMLVVNPSRFLAFDPPGLGG